MPQPAPPDEGETERQKPDDWQAYHQALGRFLCRYADMEILLHIMLRVHASVSTDVLRCLVGAPRTGDLISLIKRVSRLGGASDTVQSVNDACFQQLSQISSMRDLIVHRKTEYYGVAYMSIIVGPRD
jgi:hypothetical protein